MRACACVFVCVCACACGVSVYVCVPVKDEDKIDVMRCASRLACALLCDPLPPLPEKKHWWPCDSKQTWCKKGDKYTVFVLYVDSGELIFQEVHRNESMEPVQCKVRQSGFFASWARASWNDEVFDGQAGIQFEFDVASQQFIEKRSHVWKLWEGSLEAFFERSQEELPVIQPDVSMGSLLDTHSEESMALQGEWHKVGSYDRDSFQVKEEDQGYLWFVERWNRRAPITVQHCGFRTRRSKESWNIDGGVFFRIVKDEKGHVYLLEKDMHVWLKRA